MSALHPQNRCALCGATEGLRDGILAATNARAPLCMDTVGCVRRRNALNEEGHRELTLGAAAPAAPSSLSALDGGGPEEQDAQAAPQDLAGGPQEAQRPLPPSALTCEQALRILYELVAAVHEADPHGYDDRDLGRALRNEVAGVTLDDAAHLVTVAVGERLMNLALAATGDL